jgi:hypothetical protein
MKKSENAREKCFPSGAVIFPVYVWTIHIAKAAAFQQLMPFTTYPAPNFSFSIVMNV